MKTTFALRLENDLENEMRRMANEWFFKWHYIGGNAPVEIDGFDGRKIRYAGIGFGGSSRIVYWNALGIYVKKKVDEVFAHLNEELEISPGHIRGEMVIETYVLCKTFNALILQKADQTENLLLKKKKTRGVNYYEYKCEASKFSLIEQYKDSLIAKYEIDKRQNVFQKIESLAKKYPYLIGTILVGVILLIMSSVLGK